MHSSLPEDEAQIQATLSMIDDYEAGGTIDPAKLRFQRVATMSFSASILRDYGRYSETLSIIQANLAFYESRG